VADRVLVRRGPTAWGGATGLAGSSRWARSWRLPAPRTRVGTWARRSTARTRARSAGAPVRRRDVRSRSGR